MSFRRPAMFATVLCLALALVSRDVAALPAEDERWSEFRSAHFIVYTRASEARTRAVLTGLETLREVLRQITPDLQAGRMEVNSPVPTYVFVFPNEKSFRPYRGGRNLGGYFSPRPDGNYVAVQVDSGSALNSVYHEYLHYFVQQNFPTLPLWLNEGLAEFYSTMARNSNGVDLGEPVPGHLALLSEQTYPLASIADVTYTSADYNEAGRQGAFYATSWGFVDYLLTGSPERRAQFGMYLQSLRAGTEPQAAFAHAFSGGPASLEAEVRTHLRHMIGNGTYRYWRMRFADLKVADDVQVRPMARDEVLARTGLLLSDPWLNESSQAARENLEAALTLNPKCAPALFGLGLLQMHPEPKPEAREYFRKAIEADPDLPMAHYLWAIAYTGSGFHVLNPSEAREIRTHLERHLALSPGHVQAERMLEQVLTPTERAQRRRALLEAAFARSPGPDSAQPLLKEYFDQQDFVAAQALLEKLLAESKDDEVRATVAHNMAVVRFNIGAQMVQQGRVEEGRALLKRAVDEAPTPEVKARLVAQLPQAMTPPPAPPPPPAPRRDFRWEYEHAMNLAIQDRNDEAEQALVQIEQSATDPDLLARVKASLSEVRAKPRTTAPRHMAPELPDAGPGGDRAGLAQLATSMAMAQRGEMDAELAMLDKLAANSPDPNVREIAADRAKAIRTTGTEARTLRLFNAAVAKNNRGDVRGAVPLMEEVEKTTPRADMRKKAHDLLDRWRAFLATRRP